MYTHHHTTASHAYGTPQEHAPLSVYGTTQGYTSSSTYAPDPGYATAPHPVPHGIPIQSRNRPYSRTPTPKAPLLNPVQVPAGCYPIELVQFWNEQARQDEPAFLHWALFVRTMPASVATITASAVATHTSSSHYIYSSAHGSGPSSQTITRLSGLAPRGHFYELAGTVETYTAQFLPDVMFEPETCLDWRGTYVIGWVSPGQLHVFEQVVRQVQVWRYRSDWRCQQWVYDVARAVGENYQGLFMNVNGMTFGGLQKHMTTLLEAWENGDI